MEKKQKKTYCVLSLYEKFLREMKSGRKVQPNAKRYSEGTIKNYANTKKLLYQFSKEKLFDLRVTPQRLLTARETEVVNNYWRKFYRRFTDYLYDDLEHFDNYVGSIIKNLKSFLNYLNRDLGLGIGDFYKTFYVRKEEISIYALLPEELNYFICNQLFESSLTKRLQDTEDVFVFGCTVALRISDLIKLKKSALRIVGENHYLSVRSEKTSTDTLIKLPPYAIDIIKKYQANKSTLLPSFNKSNLNQYIKQLLKGAGFTQSVDLYRERRGKRILLKKGKVRFCDVVSTHTMRRTAITTMLCLGMPEQLVRKISGHAPGTKEFYRYVLWAQTYQDQESEKVFQKLYAKALRNV